MEGLQPPKKNAPKYPYATMKELRAARREEQSLDRPAHDGERDDDLGQERGRGERLPRQDHERHGGDGEGRPDLQGRRAARPDQAALQGVDGLRAGPGRQVRGGQGDRAGLGLRARRLRGECARPSRHHRADRRLGRRDAGDRLRAGRRAAQGAAREDPRGPAGRPRDRLSLQAQRHPGGGRRRLPVGDRRRLGDGGRPDLPDPRHARRRCWRMPPSRRSSIISA